MNILKNQKEDNVFIFDTGRGPNRTVTEIAGHVFEYVNHQQELRGYQDKSKVKVFLIVNTFAKSYTKNRNLLVLSVMNYYTLIDCRQEKIILLSHLR